MSEMQSQINALKAQIVDLKSSKESIPTTKPVWSPSKYIIFSEIS